MNSGYLTSPRETDEMPQGIPYIVGNEAAERFSFYGMKAILAVFMTQHLLSSTGTPDYMSDEDTKVWIHTFVSASYLFPILGAILADWLFGKYHTILTLSLMYCVGHGVLALMDVPQLVGLEPRQLLWWGLAFIALGAGGIKPCVQSHVGDQFGRQNQHRLTRVFAWFYFSINLGATASTLLTPVLLERYGAGWAFGVPGVLMAIATVVFWMGRKVFVHVPPAGTQFFTETFSRDGLRAIGNLIPLYAFIAVFWCLFDQTASAWVLQAENMNRQVPLPGGKDFEILSSQFQALNPIFVMLLIPLFAYGVYPLLGRFFKVTPLRKIGIGLFLTIGAFAVSALLEEMIVAGKTPHLLWQSIAWLVITAAEIFVSITALEFSYTQAPRKMKSFVMGLYLLSIAAGNLLTAAVNEYISVQKKAGASFLEGASYYWFFTGLMAVTAVLYTIYSQFYRGRTYIQGDDFPVDENVAGTGEPSTAGGTGIA